MPRQCRSAACRRHPGVYSPNPNFDAPFRDMIRLPTNAIPAAEFLVRHLYRPIEVTAGSRYFAVVETEHGTFGDNWFWNDDNAKVLEFMSRPEVWRRFPQETSEILRFVRSMCHGPFIFRRVSTPQLDLIGTEGGVTTYRHSLMQLRYDLAQGAVVAGVRFHDERNADALMLHGNYVAFTYRGRRFKEPVGRDGSGGHAERDGHRLRLRHASELQCNAGWQRQRRRLGEIAYTYTFDAMSMLFEVEAVLDLDPGIAVSDVVLTIGHGGLAYCFFNNIVTDASAVPLFSAGKPGMRSLNAAGASYYAIRQGHISGDSLAVHSIPRGPQPLAGFEAAVEIQGRLDRIVARYEFPGPHRGGRLVAAEHKLITAGGFYDRVADYAAFIKRESAASAEPRAAYDFSISYDYGVTLNAFAKCFAVASAGDVDTPFPPEELRSIVDQIMTHYFELYVDRHAAQPNAIFSRELAFVILGIATMYRATGGEDYRRRLVRLCEVLLDFEVRFDDHTGTPASAFLMRKDSPRAPYVDCHSAVLLALTQAARYVADPRLPAAIAAGLRSYGLETCRFAGGLLDTVQTLMIDEHGTYRTENAFWNFKAGLTLRFFLALREAADPRLRAIAERNRERIELIEAVIRRQLENSVTEHDDGIELRCSVLSAETNSESQPWAMLGLLGHPYA